MSEIGTLFSQCVRNFKVEIRNILVSYKNVFIHRAKTACLCQDLLQFFKSLPNDEDDKAATPNELHYFNQLSQLLGKLEDLFTELSENNFLNTVMMYEPLEIGQEITSFRNEFNNLILSLKLSNTIPLIINITQDSIDDHADCDELLQRLELIEDPSEEIREKIVLYQKQIRIYDGTESTDDYRSRKTLEPDEIDNLTRLFDKWKIPHEDIQLQEKIGSGGFADVYSGYQKSTGLMIAIKKLHVTELTNLNFDVFFQEISFMTDLDHFAILPFVGVCTTPPYCIITEFMSNGNLFDRIHSDIHTLDATKHTIIALGIAHGMAYLHSKQVLHRDLKSLNILLDADDFPRICDFGMSRYMPDDGSLMTGGIGTVQWMAPEVIESSLYTEKADVYSYGVLLWEMLTHDIPYKNIRDVQIAYGVVSQNLRPFIPHDCPPKLRKLMRLCWDVPENRPSFQVIAEAFDSGKIAFPGTSHEPVAAYLNQFMNQDSIISKEISAKADSLDTIIDLLKGDALSQQAGIKALSSFLQPENSIIHVKSSKLIRILVTVIEECSSPSLAYDLVELLDDLLPEEELQPIFAEYKISTPLLDLFLKYGSTTMRQFIHIFKISIEIDEIKLSLSHFSKLSSFLVSNDISLRISITELFSLIIKKGCFINDTCLTPTVGNLLKNILPEMAPQLLISSLDLLYHLAGFPQPFAQIDKLESSILLIPLFQSEYDEILYKVFEVCKRLLSNTQPPILFVTLFLNNFNMLIKTLPDDQHHHLLALLSCLMRSPSIYSELSSRSDIIESFHLCLIDEDDSIVIFTLKLCFVLLSNQISAPIMCQLYPEFLDLLTSEDRDIRFLAASDLTLALPKLEMKELLTDNLALFILSALDLKDKEMCSAALRISGVLTSSKRGAMFLEFNEIMKKSIKLLKCNDQSIQQLAMTLVAAQSGSLSYSDSLIDCVDDVFENDLFTEYSLIYSANISATEKGSKKLMGYSEKLLDHLLAKEAKIICHAVLTLQRMVKIPEVVEYMLNNNILSSFCTKIDALRSEFYTDTILDIYSSLIQNEKTIQSLKDIEINKYVDSLLSESKTNSARQKTCYRIKSILQKYCN